MVIDFRAAVEALDPDAIAATLGDDVVFRSPVAFKPYQGKAITAAILRGVLRVFEDFRYVRELSGEGGRDHALVFEARIGDVAVEGGDFLHLDESGLIDEFTVMVRPHAYATHSPFLDSRVDRKERVAAGPQPADLRPPLTRGSSIGGAAPVTHVRPANGSPLLFAIIGDAHAVQSVTILICRAPLGADRHGDQLAGFPVVPMRSGMTVGRSQPAVAPCRSC